MAQRVDSFPRGNAAVIVHGIFQAKFTKEYYRPHGNITMPVLPFIRSAFFSLVHKWNSSSVLVGNGSLFLIHLFWPVM